jgi:CheY-like chemotaxis protein
LDLNGVVAEVEKLLRRVIGEKIELRTKMDSSLGRVRADRGQIEQVILNLSVNARDAMPEGGKLTLETTNIELDEAYARTHSDATPGSYVMLAVSDTGKGMDAATRARVFEPFFTTKERGKGTGLGLSTVYGIVKQSGGHIWLYSEPGRGTTFKIYFPRVTEAASLAEPLHTASNLSGGSETVLVVEDEEAVRTLECEALARCGYRVFEAQNAEQALALSEEHPEPIHILVTDMVMPGKGGHELARELLRSRPDMKILYLSGYTENQAVLLEEQNNSAFLQKPFTLIMLASKVRELLDLETAKRSARFARK